MYMRRTQGAKRDPVKQWRLPDRVFFAAGACHVLAAAFLREYPHAGFHPIWIRPAAGHTGNHVVTVRGDLAFDYHGYSDWRRLVAHYQRRASQWSPGWTGTLVPLAPDALTSAARSRTYDGLHLKEPRQYLYDAMPRAQAYLRRFPPPPRDQER